jgi:hypothetical protein
MCQTQYKVLQRCDLLNLQFYEEDTFILILEKKEHEAQRNHAAYLILYSSSLAELEILVRALDILTTASLNPSWLSFFTNGFINHYHLPSLYLLFTKLHSTEKFTLPPAHVCLFPVSLFCIYCSLPLSFPSHGASPKANKNSIWPISSLINLILIVHKCKSPYLANLTATVKVWGIHFTVLMEMKVSTQWRFNNTQEGSRENNRDLKKTRDWGQRKNRKGGKEAWSRGKCRSNHHGSIILDFY